MKIVNLIGNVIWFVLTIPACFVCNLCGKLAEKIRSVKDSPAPAAN